MKAASFKTFSALLLSLAFACSSAAQGALSPARLRCEYAVEPMGIDVAQPRLYWIVQSEERGEKQTAFQILVASSTNLLAEGQADSWDSGKVESDQSTHVRYGGKELKSSDRVFWKVRVWDKDGDASGWSEPASWTMGLLRAEDWKAQWICAPATTEALLLRKEFDVRPRLVRATAYVCGLGQYELFLNGAKAGDDLLSPGWTDYNDTVLYDTRDVTALLQEGRNAIGLTLANGIYNVVRRNRFVKFNGSFGALRAICQLRLEYADGSTQTVGTDDSWRTSAGPIVFSNIYSGEDYDARLNPVGWDKPGFDDRNWRDAVALVRPQGQLRGHSVAAEPLRAIEARAPIAVRQLTNGDTLYDLGQNASYMPRIKISGPAGSTVRLTPGEVVRDDGTIDRGTMGGTGRGLSWWEYTKATDDVEAWMPQFCYIGCRYFSARLTPASSSQTLPRIESLEGVIVHSTAAPTGDFRCSNELLNRIRTMVRWAQRANMVSVLTDCPHREKLGWLEQYHLNGPAIRYEFDVARIFTKGMNDMADSQLAGGAVPNIAPEYTEFNGAFRTAAEWGAAFIVVPWQQHLFNGDRDLLATHYDDMKRYFAYLESRATNDILSEGLGDWYDYGPQKSSRAELTPPPVTATAFYFYDAQILSQAAAILGKPDDAKVFSANAGRIRASYNREFFNSTNGSYATGSQCANALPLALGIAEEEHRSAVLAALVRDIESRGYSTTAGDVGFRFVLKALAQGGRSDVIYRMLNQEDQPGYGYMLKQGATSLTEAWDARRNASHNHFMLGHVTEWFYGNLAGIATDPEAPGFKKIRIQPTPVGDVTWAEAGYDSMHGRISVRWEREPGKFRLKLDIPANTTATVFLPCKAKDGVTENAAPVNQSEGVMFERFENERAIYSVASGNYQFESPF